jgi:hypothetical protein
MDKTKFWYCWVENTRAPMFQHSTLSSAVTESERLARLPENLGKAVIILEAVKWAMVEPMPCIVKDMVIPDELPF